MKKFLGLNLLKGALIVCIFVNILYGESDQIPRLIDKAESFLAKGNVISAREYLLRAKALGKTDPLVVAFEKKLDDFVKTEVARRMKEGDDLLAVNDIPRALEHFQAIIRIIPGHPEAMERIQRITQIKTQIAHYQSHGIIVTSPDAKYDVNKYSAVSSMLKAKALLEKAKLDEAMQVVQTILDREPGFKEAKELQEEIRKRQKFKDLVTSAEMKAEKGNYEEAEEFYSQCLQIKPNDIENLILRGRARNKLGRFAQALDDFYLAYSLGADFKRLRTDILTALVGSGQYLVAYGVSGQIAGLPSEPLSFRIWCFWKSYRFSCVLVILCCIANLFAVGWIANNLVLINEKGRLSTVIECLICLVRCTIVDRPEEHAEKFRKIAKILRVSWLHYIAGVVLLASGRKVDAQEHLQFAIMDRSFAPRAYFFLGVIRSELKESLSSYDFEQAFIDSLKWHPKPWVPGFVCALEKKLVLQTKANDQMEVKLATKAITALLEVS